MSDGTYTYDYDAEGNRTKRTKIVGGNVDLYTWDYRNRLTKVVSQTSSGTVTRTVGYEYDVDDQRVKKTVDGVVENYFIDRDQIAFVTDGSGDRTFHYLYGLNVDAVMAQDSPAGMVWALARLGSIDLLTDKDGVVVDKRTFDSFGRVLSETNPSVSFRYGYTGRERDLESGLSYYRARYYDPQVGRFISVDPMGFEAGDTNLYRYVGNSSTMATDPTGMWSLQEAWNNGVKTVQQGWDYVSKGTQKNLNFWGQAASEAGSSIAQSVSNIRLPSVEQIGQGLQDFGKQWNRATNFWGDLISHNPFTDAAQSATESWARLAVEGQREGGVIGFVKQSWGWGGGLYSSLANPNNILKTAETLAIAWGGSKFAVTKIGQAFFNNPVVRFSSGLKGVEYGSKDLGKAYSGVDDDGRQLSTPERAVTAFNGILTVATSAIDLGGFLKLRITTNRSFDGRMYAVPRDKSGNRLTEYGTGGGGYRNGDTGVHNQLSPGVNRASGNRNNTADARIQSHHGVQTEPTSEWASRHGITEYNSDQSPTVLLSTAPGQPHALINQMQRAAGHGNGETLRQTFNRGYSELIASGVDRKLANKVMKENYKHYTELIEKEIAAGRSLPSLKDNFDSLP
jgi:RHS repeat-associated protein